MPRLGKTRKRLNFPRRSTQPKHGPAKGYTLATIADEYAKVGQQDKFAQILTQALEATPTIEDEESKAWTLYHFASRYAKAGQFALALETVQSIKDLLPKSEALTAIAGEYAKTGQFAQAIETVKTMRVNDWDACECGSSCIPQALIAIVKSVDVGQKEKADPILSQAIEIAQSIAGAISSEVFAVIAGKYAEVGQFTQAIQTAQTIEDEHSKVDALASIAGEYAKIGQNEKANQLLSQAVATAQTIEEQSSKAEIVAAIAKKLAKAGQFSEAPCNGSDDEQSSKAEIVTAIAKLAKAGQFKQALVTVQTIEDKQSKAEALTVVAGQIYKTGYKLGGNDLTNLRRIVHATMPMTDLWQQAANQSSKSH